VGEKKVPHPLIKELRSAQKQLHAIGSALGFDPTARSRLGLAEVKRQSKLEELSAARQAR
jgi:P27 family predicted phage terminase small subunit